MFTKRWCPKCKFSQYDPHICKETGRLETEGRSLDIHELTAKALNSTSDFLTGMASSPPKPNSPELLLLVFNSDGINGGFIPGLSTVALTAVPQLRFRPKRLVVPSELGSSFSLGDLKIGNCSMFASHAGSGVSMSVFPPDPDPSKGFPIDNLAGMPAVEVGQYLTMAVTNLTNAALRFSALVYGETGGQ